jgi:hypothetical protein
MQTETRQTETRQTETRQTETMQTETRQTETQTNSDSETQTQTRQDEPTIAWLTRCAVMNFYYSISYTEDMALAMWATYKDMPYDMIWSHLTSKYGSLIAPYKANIDGLVAKRAERERIFRALAEFYRSLGYSESVAKKRSDDLNATFTIDTYQHVWNSFEANYGEVRMAPWKAKGLGRRIPTAEEFQEDWTYDKVRQMLVVILCKDSRRLKSDIHTMSALEDAARALAFLARAGYGNSYEAMWASMEAQYGADAIHSYKLQSTRVPAIPSSI